MSDLADFIARHAIALLLLVACLWLLVTALYWHVVHAYGDRVWTTTLNAWNALRPQARRFKRIPIAGPLVARTFSIARYLGLYAVLGFIVAVGAVGTFVELADEIGFDEDLAQFDADLAEALSRHLSYSTLRVFSVITHLGDPDFLTALGAVVTLVLLWKKRWVLAAAWLTTTIGGGFLNILLKRMFERPRPVHEHGLAHETSFSFPSGHAAGSMLVYSLLGYLLIRHSPRAWHIPIAVGMVTVIVFVGSSRVLLQVHYFSDVLAGYASAAAWVAMCIAGLETLRWRSSLNQPAEAPPPT